ncbi:MAG: hypothetical protein ACXABY_36385 [Candidatus Thorarchaeota archaeon]|jgi:hypothetical protein
MKVYELEQIRKEIASLKERSATLGKITRELDGGLREISLHIDTYDMTTGKYRPKTSIKLCYSDISLIRGALRAERDRIEEKKHQLQNRSLAGDT